jgi:hypothetical protein
MKYTAVALVGAAAANIHEPRIHNIREHFHKKCHVINALFGEVETCPALAKGEKMNDATFIRKAIYATHNAAVKGWFADDRDFPVDQKCFGDWMEPMFQKFHDIHSAWKTDGIWGIDAAQIKSAFDDLIDAKFTNMEACGIYTIMWENYDWCINNVEQCIFQHGAIERVTEKGLEFIGDLFQLHNIKKQDPTCFTDEQLLERWAEETLIVTSGLRDFHGFPGHYDTTKAVPHTSWRQMHNNMKSAIHEHKKNHKCPVKAFFENIMKEETSIAQPQESFAFEMPPIFQFQQPQQLDFSAFAGFNFKLF